MSAAVEMSTAAPKDMPWARAMTAEMTVSVLQVSGDSRLEAWVLIYEMPGELSGCHGRGCLFVLWFFATERGFFFSTKGGEEWELTFLAALQRTDAQLQLINVSAQLPCAAGDVV